VPTGPLFPAGETWFGKTPAEWAVAWWNWSLPIPRATNPMRGGPCDQNQTGDVFFLAGNFGRVETRSCTIPAGKAIYFPIINDVCKDAPEAGCQYMSTEAELLECGRLEPEHSVSLSIDGVAIEDLEGYHTQSAPFEVLGPGDRSLNAMPCIGPIGPNHCEIPEGTRRIGVTDGYWVMLRPLPPGPHTIHFAGSTGPASAPWALDMTYQITVAEAP
jgi:hypothetical protein